MDRQRFRWVLRGLLLAGVLGMALYAFHAGVTLSNRSDLTGAGWMTQLYYAAGLFVMGGLDLGMPVGGPAFDRALLWLACFSAPLITTSAVVEGALRLVGSGAVERLGLKNHLVVIGLGRLGSAFIAAFRERAPHATVLAMDRDVTHAAAAVARRQMRVLVLQGDARIRRGLDAARLVRSRGVAIVTDDDLLNLEVAFRIARQHAELPVVAHVSDIALQRAVNDIHQANTKQRVFVFNAHRMAAEHLYDEHLRAYFKQTTPRDPVVIAGFGRFGQSIFEFLDQQARGEIARVVVIDRDARLALRKYRAQSASLLCAPDPVDGDLADPQTWESVAEKLASCTTPPVIIVGADNDVVNLKAALHARRRWPAARLFVRCQNESSFTEELARRHQIEPLAVDAILERALQAAQARWYG